MKKLIEHVGEGPAHFFARQHWAISSRRERLLDSLQDWLSARSALGPVEGSTEPLVTCVIPTYNTRPEWLEAALHSLQVQSDPRWEAVIYDDGSSQREHIEVATRLSDVDARIKVILGAENVGISSARNKAIVAGRGQYILFLDHDDIIHPLCLSLLITEASDHIADFVYANECKSSEDGQALGHFFKKCGPHPSVALHYNYVCHPLLVLRSALERIAVPSADTQEHMYFQTGFDGAEDHELVMRMLEAGLAGRHVSAYLYHWRMSDRSTASDASNKPEANQRKVSVAQSHMARRGWSIRNLNAEGADPLRDHPLYLLCRDDEGRDDRTGVLRVGVATSDGRSLLNRLWLETQMCGDNVDFVCIHNDFCVPDPKYVECAVGYLQAFAEVVSVGLALRSADSEIMATRALNGWRFSEVPGNFGFPILTNAASKRHFGFEVHPVIANGFLGVIYRLVELKSVLSEIFSSTPPYWSSALAELDLSTRMSRQASKRRHGRSPAPCHLNLGGGLRAMSRIGDPLLASGQGFRSLVQFVGEGVGEESRFMSEARNDITQLLFDSLAYDTAFANQMILDHLSHLKTEFFSSKDIF